MFEYLLRLQNQCSIVWPIFDSFGLDAPPILHAHCTSKAKKKRLENWLVRLVFIEIRSSWVTSHAECRLSMETFLWLFCFIKEQQFFLYFKMVIVCIHLQHRVTWANLHCNFGTHFQCNRAIFYKLMLGLMVQEAITNDMLSCWHSEKIQFSMSSRHSSSVT